MASSSFSSFFSPEYLLHLPKQQPSHGEEHRQALAHADLGALGPMIGKRSVENAAEEEELSEEDGMPPAEKKRRLNLEQVRMLEKNFEQGNKLEPERKMQLAVALGLQPRQVAVWFQNRRARWKTKQLEKDYDALKLQLEAVKSENEALQSHNKKLQAEIMALRGRSETSELINLNKETEGSCSENSSEINLDMASASLHPHQVLPFLASIRPAEMEAQRSKTAAAAAEGSFSNLLCSMEDHSASFWPWPDHHSFH